jgi:hypothetical protein
VRFECDDRTDQPVGTGRETSSRRFAEAVGLGRSEWTGDSCLKGAGIYRSFESFVGLTIFGCLLLARLLDLGSETFPCVRCERNHLWIVIL